MADEDVRPTHLRRKRAAASAGLRRVRVYEYETLLHQRLLVVQDHAVQVDEGFRVDKHTHVVKVKDAIALPRLRIEADVVAQARTTAALHTQAQTAFGRRNAFLRHRAANFGDRLLRHLDALDGGSRYWGCDRLESFFCHDAHQTGLSVACL